MLVYLEQTGRELDFLVDKPKGRVKVVSIEV